MGEQHATLQLRMVAVEQLHGDSVDQHIRLVQAHAHERSAVKQRLDYLEQVFGESVDSGTQVRQG